VTEANHGVTGDALGSRPLGLLRRTGEFRRSQTNGQLQLVYVIAELGRKMDRSCPTPMLSSDPAPFALNTRADSSKASPVGDSGVQL
jgi:hypothetical protein